MLGAVIVAALLHVSVRRQKKSLPTSDTWFYVLFSSTRGGGAGQAVVRMATYKYSRQESALKFFLCVDTFQREARQYTDGSSALSQFLPSCCHILANDDGRCCSRSRRVATPSQTSTVRSSRYTYTCGSHGVGM